MSPSHVFPQVLHAFINTELRNKIINGKKIKKTKVTEYPFQQHT